MTLLAALLAAEENADAFERMLLAALVHPEVAGCERGWLLLWNPRARRFHVARQGRASHRPGDLRTALARARHAVPAERGDEAPAWSTGEAELDGALRGVDERRRGRRRRPVHAVVAVGRSAPRGRRRAAA